MFPLFGFKSKKIDLFTPTVVARGHMFNATGFVLPVLRKRYKI